MSDYVFLKFLSLVIQLKLKIFYFIDKNIAKLKILIISHEMEKKEVITDIWNWGEMGLEKCGGFLMICLPLCCKPSA